jgi:tight adherence protein B
MTTMLSNIDLAYILLFGASALFVEGVWLFVQDLRVQTASASRRERLLTCGARRRPAPGRLRRAETDPLSAVIARALPGMERLIHQAGLTIAPRTLLAISVAVAGAVQVLLVATTALPVAMTGLWTVMAGFGLPLAALMHRRRRRLARFGQQLPEALDVMVRCLRAGHPIAAAIGMVAGEMATPIGTEFAIVVDEMTYGLDLNAALANLCLRIAHPDLPFFRVAVQIQHQTGGNLSEVLANLASVIRDRFTMNMKVTAITAQGRSGAFVIGALPLVSMVVINLLNPKYFGEVWEDPLFLPVMAVAGLLWLGGLAMIRQMVRFRI